MKNFEIAAGSVLGRDHALAGRNNQDAWHVWRAPEGILAVVCDGCGSGRWSETGAQVGSRLVVEALRGRLPSLSQEGPEALLEAVRLDVLGQLRGLATALGGSTEAIGQHLLFTILGAMVTPTLSVVFALGDGVTAVNGEIDTLACADNAPPYLAYALNESAAPLPNLRFDLRHVLSTSSLSSLLIGTDGTLDLLSAADRRLPGREQAVGPLHRLWEDASLFANPAALTRRLHLMNQSVQHIDWKGGRVEREPGLLRDDTTLVVVRRKAGRP